MIIIFKPSQGCTDPPRQYCSADFTRKSISLVWTSRSCSGSNSFKMLEAKTKLCKSGNLYQDVSVVLIQLNRPFHPGALLVQAGALYAMGDFEHALVSYHKANSVESLLMREKREIEVGAYHEQNKL